jgi:hypothetical protein
MKTNQPQQLDGPSPEAVAAFELITNSMLTTILEKLPRPERKKLLWIQRLLAHPSSHAWLDAEMAKLDDIALDPEWQAQVLHSDWRKLPGFIKPPNF